ncbi:hypothetical protein IQE94_03010 [Synechocystis sp. PCC 7339]|uniref:beta-carboxysome assembly chaperone CcmS n=1 Tax=unclassified Synechocystis TaxID=2640012 RepID=UPI001BAE8344|nr:MULTISPECIES: hypothetical protein [unclassified Synechocystis]QUS61133.1 hypothetical protein HTZ78_10945 [Synechocystis sp. PCC 7338]UAJ73315.1 hypothetical protein IQE94_03010 [Synechocystis sp. PCC 7339]
MFSPDPVLPDDGQHPWRYRLDQFTKEEQTALAALAWAFYQQWPAKEQYLGLDLHPQAHFISCAPQAIAKLNDQVNGRIQEMVGILHGYDPVTEVAIFVIGPTQFKLLFFQPTPDPAGCFAELGLTIEELKHRLEQILQEKLT